MGPNVVFEDGVPMQDPTEQHASTKIAIELQGIDRGGQVSPPSQIEEETTQQAPIKDDDDRKTELAFARLISGYWKMRFGLPGRLMDLAWAVAHYSQVVPLLLYRWRQNPNWLYNLGRFHQRRFERLGEIADIEQAIVYLFKAASLTPDEDAKKSTQLTDLGTLHQLRFERLGEPADIEKSIAYRSQVVLLNPEGHPRRPICLNNLGISYQNRFERFGKLADMEKSFQCFNQANLLLPDGHMDKPLILSNLGNLHHHRFETLGELADIEKAITCKSQAVSLTPEQHADLPRRLSNLGISLKTRFVHLGKPVDIEQSIACLSLAILLTPDGHPGKPVWLSSLGASYQRRFQSFGGVEDLDQSFQCFSQAIQLTPDGHAAKPGLLNNLGSSYQCRFERLGELADIDKAISYRSQVVLLTPDGNANKPGRLGNLGSSYQCRFEYLEELADIDKAISCFSRTVLLTTDTDSNKPGWLSNLGLSYRVRFELRGELADLNESITYLLKAVVLAPDGHVSKPGWLSHLGCSYRHRFIRLGELSDMNQSIACHSQALQLTPDGNADKPGWLNNLGVAYKSRFDRFGELPDIDQAIVCHSQAVSLTPDGDAEKAGLLRNLGKSHRRRFLSFGEPIDLDLSISAYQLAAKSPTGSLKTRLRAARTWARLASRVNSRASLPGYQLAMDLVPSVVWIGSIVSHRYDSLHKIGAVAIEAAATAISANEYALALEWLEEGRSIVWNQTLQLRNPFDDLYLVAPGLARNLKQITRELERASLRASDTIAPEPDAYTSETTAQNHHRLAERYDILLSEVRQLPGFDHFMRPKRTAELLAAAKSGPVVVINVHTTRCDALILHPDGTTIAHVPLPDLSHEDVTKLQQQLQISLASQGLRERKPNIAPARRGGQFKNILAALWYKIAQPVLDSLGYTENPPVEPLPHITWCTTGVLAFLPIHAAGCYDEPGLSVPDLAVSSYAPTLSALLGSRPHSLQVGGLLAVSEESTLPGTKEELGHIKRLVGGMPYMQLERDQATPEAVLNFMEQHGSVHLACHASQNTTNPTESCFHLHGSTLSLSAITKRSLKNKSLAFLSACQTAAGHEEMPDEAIHLAAGMLVAGYSTVIATMWSINDNDAPLIANKVYGDLVECKKLQDGNAARALHAAVASLRARVGEDAFARWVPYVHIGV